jgi:hypothetical protein
MVSFAQYAIEQLPIEQLKAVGRRLRQAHVRAKDISARQQREIRGKVDPRGARPTRDNSGTVAKARCSTRPLSALRTNSVAAKR